MQHTCTFTRTAIKTPCLTMKTITAVNTNEAIIALSTALIKNAVYLDWLHVPRVFSGTVSLPGEVGEDKKSSLGTCLGEGINRREGGHKMQGA